MLMPDPLLRTIFIDNRRYTDMSQEMIGRWPTRKGGGVVGRTMDTWTSSEAFGKSSGEVSADVAAVASLDEPTRRGIYDHVCAHSSPVSRDEVTEALGIPRRTAAFHLDRLAELGLLSVSFARRSGRSGPGAGRTAKL